MVGVLCLDLDLDAERTGRVVFALATVEFTGPASALDRDADRVRVVEAPRVSEGSHDVEVDQICVFAGPCSDDVGGGADCDV